MACAYYWRLHSMPYYLSVIGKSSTGSGVQAFYDTGKGYNEADSATIPLSPSNTFEELVFPLPTEIIRNLRIDPLSSSGSVEIQRATIRGRKKIQQYLPSFIFQEAAIGKDPDQRNYVVSNKKIEDAGFSPIYSLDLGIQELAKGYAMIKNSKYGNI